jgi:hypothetical protein
MTAGRHPHGRGFTFPRSDGRWGGKTTFSGRPECLYTRMVYIALAAVFMIGGCAPRTTTPATPTQPVAAKVAASPVATQPIAVAAVKPTVRALPPFPPVAAVVTNAGGEGAVMRALPGDEAELMKLLPDGTRVVDRLQIQQANGRAWKKVADGSGAEGWVDAQFLELAPRAVAPPRTAPAPTVARAVTPAILVPKPADPTAPIGAAAQPKAPSNPLARDLTCADFESQAAAQAQLRANPRDPYGLDTDGNGVACESNGNRQDREPVRP